MAGPNDPNLDIRIKTLGGTEADRELKKVEDRLKAMDAAEQKLLKTQRVFGDESEQMANHLSKLTQEAKASGAAAQQAAGLKVRWLDAIKKLTHEIPGLGYVVGALKNPLVAVIAVIAIFLDSLAKIKQRIDEVRDAVGNGTIITNFEKIGSILAQGKIDAAELAAQLARISGRGPSIDEAGEKMIADFDRKLSVEERNDPEGKGKESRAQRRLDFVAGVKASQALRAREELRSGTGSIEREAGLLQSARDRHRRVTELADAQTTGPAGIARLEQELGDIDNTLAVPVWRRNYAGLQLTSAFRGDAGLRDYRAMVAANLENAKRGDINVGALRANADADLAAAQGRFNRFSTGLTGSAEAARTLGLQTANAVADAAANDPTAPARGRASQIARTHLENQYQAQFERLMQEFSKAVVKSVQRAIADIKRQANSD